MNPPKGIDPKVWEMAIALADIWQAPMRHDYQVFAEDVAGSILKAKNDAYEEAAKAADGYRHKEAGFRAQEPDKSVYGWGTARREIAQAIRNLKHGTEV